MAGGSSQPRPSETAQLQQNLHFKQHTHRDKSGETLCKPVQPISNAVASLLSESANRVAPHDPAVRPRLSPIFSLGKAGFVSDQELLIKINGGVDVCTYRSERLYD